MVLNPLSLLDYFLDFGCFHPVIYAFGAFGLSYLVQYIVFGGFDDI